MGLKERAIAQRPAGVEPLQEDENLCLIRIRSQSLTLLFGHVSYYLLKFSPHMFVS
jgi:hypothetical protein